MADLITHSLSYAKESARDYFLKPLFVDSDITQIINVRTDIKTSEKLDYISALKKITKAYAKGSSFTSSTGVTVTQRTLTVGGVKAEVHQDGRVFLNWVKQEALKSGVDIHNITGTIFDQIVMAVWTKALARDLQSQIFFNNPIKEVITSGAPTGTLDTNYVISGYKGFWPLFEGDVITTDFPSAQVIDINTSTYQDQVAVKNKRTATMTGTSGTCNVTINGTDYLFTFTTNLNTSTANFVNSHAATILARYGRCVVTNVGATIVVEAGQPGMSVTVAVSAALTGDATGSVANTTAVVQNTTVKADGAKALFKAMYAAMPAELRGLKGEGRLRYLVTQSVYDNYMESLETASGIPQAYVAMVDGLERLTFRGIPVIARPQWDENIEEDFGSIRPHRAMLTAIDNLVFGTDGSGDTGKFDSWYNMDEQENRMRCEYLGGTQYVHPNFTVLAY